MVSEDILAKEIGSWRGFEYALREENRILFNKMLSNKEEYVASVNAKGENFAEALFMILIFEQQKMIDELMTRLSDIRKTRRTES
jgi:hypothetical protein